jgi:hypothetical protein
MVKLGHVAIDGTKIKANAIVEPQSDGVVQFGNLFLAAKEFGRQPSLTSSISSYFRLCIHRQHAQAGCGATVGNDPYTGIH